MVYTDPDEVPWSAYLAAGGIAVVLVAALLPWFEQIGTPVTGLEHDDGYLTAGVVFAAFALGVAFEWNLIARIGAALAGALAILVGYNTYDQVSEFPTHDPAYGLYLTLLGGAVLIVAAIYGSVEARREGGGADADPTAD